LYYQNYHLKNLVAQPTFFLNKYFLNSSINRRKIAKGTESNIYLMSRGEVLKMRFANGFQMMKARINNSLAIPSRSIRLLNKPIVKTD